MKMEHEHNIYPPKVKLSMLPHAHTQQQLTIKFCSDKVELKDLEIEISVDAIISKYVASSYTLQY